MVIAEIVKHPLFELVGVGVSNPDKVGRDVGEICGLGETLGLDGHRRRRRAHRAQTRRVGALRAHRRACRRQHRPDYPVPARGHRRLLDGHDAVGMADDAPQPAELDRAHHRGVRIGRVVVLHHRHRPRVRQRPVPDDADGPVLGGPQGAGIRTAGLHQLRQATTSARWASAGRRRTGDVRDPGHSRYSPGAERFR